jgi:hypothetical protein
MGQSSLWLRDVDNTTREVVILYDSMWAYNMMEGNWKSLCVVYFCYLE